MCIFGPVCPNSQQCWDVSILCSHFYPLHMMANKGDRPCQNYPKVIALSCQWPSGHSMPPTIRTHPFWADSSCLASALQLIQPQTLSQPPIPPMHWRHHKRSAVTKMPDSQDATTTTSVPIVADHTLFSVALSTGPQILGPPPRPRQSQLAYSQASVAIASNRVAGVSMPE